MCAEYILSQGNPNVVLCERGIKSFDSATRNLFDVAAVPTVHRRYRIYRSSLTRPTRPADPI